MVMPADVVVPAPAIAPAILPGVLALAPEPVAVALGWTALRWRHLLLLELALVLRCFLLL